MNERIHLRALLIIYADGAIIPAIALPDDRIIVGSNVTYSSERALVYLHPGARIEWTPQADATINHVMEPPE